MTDTKRCPKCGNEKPLDEFPSNTSHNGKSYPRKQCRICFNAGRKAKDVAYRERHRERVRENGLRWMRDNKEQARQYYQDNKEAINKKNRAYAIKHSERLKVSARKWYEENKEHVHMKTKEWVEKNPEKVRASRLRSAAKPENKAKKAAWKKQYDAKNKEKHNAYGRAKGRRHVESLADTYIINKLQRHGVKRPTQELIEAKRVQLRIDRHLREMVKTPAN